jgi:two-component system sensor histidine kinase ChiS
MLDFIFPYFPNWLDNEGGSLSSSGSFLAVALAITLAFGVLVSLYLGGLIFNVQKGLRIKNRGVLALGVHVAALLSSVSLWVALASPLLRVLKAPWILLSFPWGFFSAIALLVFSTIIVLVQFSSPWGKIGAGFWFILGVAVALFPFVEKPLGLPFTLSMDFLIFGLSILLWIFLFALFLYLILKKRKPSRAVPPLVLSLGFVVVPFFQIILIRSALLALTVALWIWIDGLFQSFRSSKQEEEVLLSDYVDQVSLVLTRFIPKEFLAILNKPNVMDLQLGDHVKQDMTIFFSDIRQFTNLSEILTPEENFKFINSYLSRIVPVISNHGGFVDKYMGDAIMALFPDLLNATGPDRGPGGADAAVRAAIEIQKKIVEYNSHRANSGYRPLAMGIGIHTGTLMIGVVGVEDRMQNTVISDAVNLASRLEGITKVFNISLAISEETFKSLNNPGAYMYRFIGKVRVKGKVDPVSVFEIFDGMDSNLQERKMRANIHFEQGMLSYYQKDFSSAMYNFRKVLEILPEDGASVFYLDNCMAKVKTP